MSEQENTVIKVNGTEYHINDYTATGLAEGFVETDNQYEILAAWQYLVLTGLAYRLQGWFGRQAEQLLRHNAIVPANEYDAKEGIHYDFGGEEV